MIGFYNTMYRFFSALDIGLRKDLVVIVECGRLKPYRVTDLGSGAIINCIFLTQHRIDLTGVDYSEAAVELGKQCACDASFHGIVHDLTNLILVNGWFDMLMGHGILDDLVPKQRELYLHNDLPLTHSKSLFLFYCFKLTTCWLERLTGFADHMKLIPGEVMRRFGPRFEINFKREV